jgi:hypothetical protein
MVRLLSNSGDVLSLFTVNATTATAASISMIMMMIHWKSVRSLRGDVTHDQSLLLERARVDDAFTEVDLCVALDV